MDCRHVIILFSLLTYLCECWYVDFHGLGGRSRVGVAAGGIAIVIVIVTVTADAVAAIADANATVAATVIIVVIAIYAGGGRVGS
jgi:hypothetical protein